MKEFFKDFFKFLSDSILIICLAFASFLFIINFFHYREVSYQYNTDLTQNKLYTDFKENLSSVEEKMQSVDYDNPEFALTAKPIYEYFNGCKDALENSLFYSLDKDNLIDDMDIYNMNNELLKEYNNVCMFNISNNILNMYNDDRVSDSFEEVYNNIETKREIAVMYAEFLTKAGLGNSAYNFSTDTFKSSIYNENASYLDLTIKNYSMIISILEDIADWYVVEFGGRSV